MPAPPVLYYSTCGHVETMANAVAEGARSVPRVEATRKRVPETMPPDVAKQHGVRPDQNGGQRIEGALAGTVGGVFASTGTGSGNERTIIRLVTLRIQHGMIYARLPYACPELAQARFQGKHVAMITARRRDGRPFPARNVINHPHKHP